MLRKVNPGGRAGTSLLASVSGLILPIEWLKPKMERSSRENQERSAYTVHIADGKNLILPHRVMTRFTSRIMEAKLIP